MIARLPTSENRVERLARKLSVLEELGLERLEPSPKAAEWARIDRDTTLLTAHRPAMSTLVSISVLNDSRVQAEEAVEKAFSAMDRLIGLLNRYEPSSAVGVLNQRGRLTDVPPELGHVVSRALRAHRQSLGAFDITVKPLVDLLRSGKPSRSDWLEARELVGSAGVELAGGRIFFRRSGMGITLDGIAKGYIVDRMADVLLQNGTPNFLINAGGDIRTAGTKGSGFPWTVAVQDPFKQDQFPDVIQMTDGAVATSGSYERRYGHIVDSETGELPEYAASVTVSAPTAVAADAMATALFTMKPDDALKLIDTLPGNECLIVDALGEQRRSEGWKSVKRAPREVGELW